MHFIRIHSPFALCPSAQVQIFNAAYNIPHSFKAPTALITRVLLRKSYILGLTPLQPIQSVGDILSCQTFNYLYGYRGRKEEDHDEKQALQSFRILLDGYPPNHLIKATVVPNVKPGDILLLEAQDNDDFDYFQSTRPQLR